MNWRKVVTEDFEDFPPPELAHRIVGRLRRERLIAREPRLRRSWTLAAAAVGLAFAFGAGFLAAKRESSADRYLLLLYGEPGPRSAARVEEYRRWAVEQRSRGREVRGERLNPEEWVVGSSGVSSTLSLLGFFLVTAGNEADAVALARSHPHVRYGGVIVVRPIDPT
jgi:hypothetical protein